MITTLTFHHKTAKLPGGGPYRAVVGLSRGMPVTDTLVFDHDDLTRFLVPGSTNVNGIEAVVKAEVGDRLYDAMKRCFAGSRVDRNPHVLPAAILRCQPVQLAAKRWMSPARMQAGGVYALVDPSTEHKIRYYAIGIKPNLGMIYLPRMGIALMDMTDALKRWAVSKRGLLELQVRK